MLRFKTNFLRHLECVNAWARTRTADVQLDHRNLDLTIELDGVRQPLYAVFVVRSGNRPMMYSRTLDHDVLGFVGWFPYEPRPWPLSSSKLAFKAYARSAGITTPDDARSADGAVVPFIIKKDAGSFGRGIRGPFRPEEGHLLSAMEQDEYGERIVLGQIIRAWYWAGTLAAYERIDMPAVVSDGRTPLIDIARTRLPHGESLPRDLDRLFAIQGYAPEQVLPIGTRCYIDYRYASPFNPTLWSNFNAIESEKGSRIHDEVIAAGQAFRPGLPPELQNEAVFVLDGVADSRDRVYFLEANSSPQLHPDLYPVMLDGLFALADRKPGQASWLAQGD